MSFKINATVDENLSVIFLKSFIIYGEFFLSKWCNFWEVIPWLILSSVLFDFQKLDTHMFDKTSET